MNLENFEKKLLGPEDLKSNWILEGDLWVVLGERKIFLRPAGSFIDEEFISKHQNKKFIISEFIDEVYLNALRKHFKDLKQGNLEKELRRSCSKIVQCFAECSKTQKGMFTFIYAAYEEFAKCPVEVQKNLYHTDGNLFRKSLFSSALAVVTSMANDFLGRSFLEDIYNVTFFLDVGLAGENYTYYIAAASDQENKNHGSGFHFLEEAKVSNQEKDIFLSHPKRSYEIIQEYNILNNSHLANALLLQHELQDGTGFPQKLYRSSISSWESVVIFSDSVFSLNAKTEDELDFEKKLSEFNELKKINLPVKRVFHKLKHTLDSFQMREKAG